MLDVAGVEGFLGNLDALYAHADLDDAAWRAFTQVWWDMHGAAELHVSVLAELCEQRDLMSEVLGDGTTRSQQVRLGRALQGVRVGQLQVIEGGADRKGRTLYALKHWGEPVSPRDAPRSVVESAHSEGTHWVPYTEDLDDDS